MGRTTNKELIFQVEELKKRLEGADVMIESLKGRLAVQEQALAGEMETSESYRLRLVEAEHSADEETAEKIRQMANRIENLIEYQQEIEGKSAKREIAQASLFAGYKLAVNDVVSLIVCPEVEEDADDS